MVVNASGGTLLLSGCGSIADKGCGRDKHAYMGWHSTYTQQFEERADYLSETFLKKQTDWMAENFLDYGYEYVCIDGWIGSGTRHNEDGYVTTFSDEWQNGWTEMAKYVHSKGMKFGMYYNPGWMLKSIADDFKLKIKGTDSSMKSIVKSGKEFQQWYEIDVNEPGAEEYVKGMVEYFISCNVDLLKVDFLSHYEETWGHENKLTLMRWIDEAAGDDILITMSMPLGSDHLKEERKFGEYIRVVGDYWKNGWKHTSAERRGVVYDNGTEIAETASNVFDGLCWVSDISGPGEDKIFVSPDYYVFHDEATDDEKKFAATIRFVSGSAIEFGDCYNNIGSDKNANYLRNSELIDLNKEAFCAKPLTRDVLDERSQIWCGYTAKKDVIIAFFNREDTAQTYNINFEKTLGLTGSYQIRDLWMHQNMGEMDSFSSEVPAHGVTVIKLYVSSKPLPDGDPNPPSALVPIE